MNRFYIHFVISEMRAYSNKHRIRINVSCETKHCIKSVRIRIFSGPYFPVLTLNTKRHEVSLRIFVRMRENNDQKNSEYGQFSRSKRKSKWRVRRTPPLEKRFIRR